MAMDSNFLLPNTDLNIPVKSNCEAKETQFHNLKQNLSNQFQTDALVSHSDG